MLTAHVLRQYHALTKPRVIQLIVFCALIGMVLAIPGVPSLDGWWQALQLLSTVWLRKP
jgi:heme o synthase